MPKKTERAIEDLKWFHEHKDKPVHLSMPTGDDQGFRYVEGVIDSVQTITNQNRTQSEAMTPDRAELVIIMDVMTMR